jgi:hypothetical protein
VFAKYISIYDINLIMKDLKEYERNPEAYIGAVHQWFGHQAAEEKRAKTRTYLEFLFY